MIACVWESAPKGVRYVLPEGPFVGANQIACVGKGRNPLPILLEGVPANVIEMQVRTQYAVNRFALEAGFGQMLERSCLEPSPTRQRKFLSISHASVDYDVQVS